MNVYLAEFIGTFILILLGNGVVANVVLPETKGNNGGWIVITTGWALAVFTAVVVVGPYSGAHINPAVTIGLAIGGEFDWNLVPGYIICQMLGAMAGALLVWLVYKDHYKKCDDQGAILATFATGPAIKNPIINILGEIAGTFLLIFVIFYFTSAEISDVKTPIGLGSIGALPVAFLVWAIGLSLGGTTGYAINPARDLGPRLTHSLLPMKNKGGNDWGYSWVPIAGPIIGSILAAVLYLCLGK